MRNVATAILFCLLTVPAAADTTIWTCDVSGYLGISSVSLTADGEGAYTVGPTTFYQGSSVGLTLTMTFSEGMWSDRYWATASGSFDAVHVSQDDSGGDSASASFSVSGQDAVRVTVWAAVDLFEVRIADATVFLHGDSTPPTIQVFCTEPGLWHAGPVIVHAEASDTDSGLDVDSMQHRVSNGPWEDGETVTVNGYGIVPVEFRVSDWVGNVATLTAYQGFDRGPPFLIISDTPPGWTNRDVSVSITALGDTQSGIAPGSPRVSLTGAQMLEEQAYHWPLTIRENGITTVHFTAKDNAGNVTTVYRILRIDRDVPAVGANIATSGVLPATWTGTTPVTVTATGSDALSGLDSASWQFSLDGGATWSAGQTSTVALPGQTTVLFRVRDQAGNTGTAQTQVWIDRAPVLSATVAPYMSVQTNGIAVSSITASDFGSGLNTATWRYSIDEGERKPLPFLASAGGVIYEPDLAEGTRQLTLSVEDSLGLEGSLALPFVVDRTPPLVSAIVITDSSGPLEENHYSRDGVLSAAITAEDSVGATGPGLIAGYRYLVTGTWIDQPDLSAATFSSSSSLVVSGLLDGSSYLFVAAVDAAGSLSSPFSRVLRIDSTAPAPPGIGSSTHARATTDLQASALADCVFLLTPALAGQSGLQSYRWALRKGLTDYRCGTLSASGVSRLEILGVDDNLAGEYYELSVWSVAGSGRESATAASYRFRVDTQPPQELQVASISHGNPDAWYPSARAVFLWNRPRDMTGVHTYRYHLSSAPIELPTDPLGWTVTDTLQLEINLASSLGSTHGEAYLGVCAEDYAGNRQFDAVRVRFDVDAPGLGLRASGNEVDVESALSQRSAVVSWGPLQDDNAEAGPARVEVRLSVVNGSAMEAMSFWRSFAPVAGSTTFDGLELGPTYCVEVRASDVAGNATSRMEFFTLDGTEPDIESVAIPFSFEQEGYRVCGSRAPLTGEISDAALELPASLDLRAPDAITGELVAVRSVPLTSVTFQGDLFSSASADPTGSFTLRVAGFTTGATGPSFSAVDGLSFDQVSYETTLYESPASRPTRTFSWQEVSLSYPPLLSFVPTQSAVTGGLGFMARHAEEGETPRDSWLFLDISGVRLGGDSLVILDAELDTQSLFDQTEAEAYTMSGLTESRRIAVSEARIGPDGDVLEAAIAEPFFLRSGDNLFDVNAAVIRGDRIVVLAASLLLPEGSTPPEVAASSFSVGTDGVLRQETGFTVGSFTWEDEQSNQFTPQSVSLQNGYLLVEAGSVRSASGATYDLGGMRFTEQGPAWDLPVTLAGFDSTVHGYRITSSTATLTQSGIALKVAYIESFPITFGGGKRRIDGLELRLSDLSVVQPGTGSETFSFTPAYGAEVSAGALSLDSAGLYAGEVTAPLPALPGGGTVSFSRLPLYSDGTIGESASRAQPTTVSLGGHEVQLIGATFNGAAVSAPCARVSLAAVLPPFDFVGLQLNASGVAQAGWLDGTFDYAQEGWTFELSELALDFSGVWCVAEVTLPAAFGAGVIRFGSLTLLPSGGFEPSTSTETFSVRIHGWIVEVSGVRIAGPVISCSTSTVRLYDTMGSGAFEVPRIALRSDGSLAASSGVGDASVEFLAENGFRVRSTRSWFDAQGLKLAGSVYFPVGLGEDVYATYEEMELASDGCILTQPQDGSVIYHLAGWNVGAEGYVFDREGLTIQTSSVAIPNTALTVCFPALSFYADGSLQMAGQSFQGIDLPFFGGGIGVSEIDLTDDGLTAMAYLSLPQNLGGSTLHFDRLTLHPDGRVTSDVSIREIGFQLAGIDFLLGSIRLDDEGLCIGEGTITLPAEMESRQLHIVNLVIDGNGNLELGGLSFDPFTLWGYTFQIASLSFADNVISFGGSITLPDSLPEGLAGRTISIDTFQVTTSGTLLSLAVTLEGDIVFPLTEDWKVVASDVGIVKDDATGAFQLVVQQGRLLFPPSIPVEEVTISGVKLNPLTGGFSFDEIAIGGVDVEEFGMAFHLTRLTISSLFDMTFSGQVTLPEDFPPAFASKTIDIERFEMRHDGTLGDVAGSLGGIEAVLFESLYLHDAEIGFAKLQDSLLLSCSGSIEFNESFPDFLAGKSVHLQAFQIDTTSGAVSSFSATSDPLSFSILGGTQVENGVIAAELDQTRGMVEVSVTGEIVLPSDLPEAFASKHVSIEAFRIGLDGKIVEFSASYASPGEQSLFGGVNLRDALVSAELLGDAVLFRVNGSLVLSSSFPQGLAGTVCAIDDLRFDSNGDLYFLESTLTLPDQTVFDVLTLRGGSIAFSKQGAQDILLTVGGELVLSDSFPQGLAGVAVTLNAFTFTAAGTILDVDAGVTGITVALFGVASIENGSVVMSQSETEGLLFTVGGDLVLPSTLPSPLAGARMSILSCTLSTKSGLIELKAGLATGIQFEVFAGIVADCNSLTIGDSGFSLTGDLQFPDTFPPGLAGTTCLLSAFAMSWNGAITSIEAGLESATISLGGFTAAVEDLLFHPDCITLGSCTVTLPPNMKGKQIGVRDAVFDYTGAFHGEFIIPTLETDIAGFTLALYEPSLDVPGKRISFSRAELRMPAIVGSGSVTLTGVQVGPSGLSFSGGEFRIPDFTIAGGLGFRSVFVKFSLADGNHRIEGGGQATVPGAGTFGATVSFVNVSSTYPWGLKQAEFSYAVYGLGLPLGATGLYLNGIRGGLAFGPPDEIPRPVQWMFNDGTRIKLGLSMTDATGGSAVRADADVWIDITDWDWAFRGNVTLLTGYVSGEVIAALTGKGFYGTFRVTLTFVEGRVEVYVYNDRGTRISGSGSIAFRLLKGCLFHRVVNLGWFGRYEINIPWRTMQLPGMYAEFGRFKNGAEGFKGYVNVPAFGQTGVFVPRSGGIVFGGVSQYVLMKPSGAKAASPAPKVPQVQRAVAGGVVAGPPEGGPAEAGPAEGGRVLSVDRSSNAGAADTYHFAVPGPGHSLSGGPVVAASRALGVSPPADSEALAFAAEGPAPAAEGPAPAAEGPAASNQEATPAPEEVERLVFALCYAEGDPLVIARSPTGREYISDDPAVETIRTDWGMLVVVPSPETGAWTLEVTGVLSSDSYQAVVFGKTRPVQIATLSPEHDSMLADGSFPVTGSVLYAPDGTEVKVFVARERGSYVGEQVATATVDAQGLFSVDVEAAPLPEGEYFVFTSAGTGDLPEAKSFAPGSILVRHPEAGLQPVSEFTACDNGSLGVDVHFVNPSGSLAKGFILRIEDVAQGTTERVLLGYIMDTTIPGFAAGDILRLSVTAYDQNNREGPPSLPVTVTMGAPSAQVNIVSLAGPVGPVHVELNAPAQATIALASTTTMHTGTALDHATARVSRAPDGISVGFDSTVWDVSDGAATIGCTIFASETLGPGEYAVELCITNAGNPSNHLDVTLPVSVSCPAIALSTVSPDSWNNRDAVEITLGGRHFYSGIRLYLDQSELAIRSIVPDSLTATVPAGTRAGARVLRLVGPAGDEVSRQVTVVEPGYLVVGLKTQGATVAGSATSFFYTVQALNGFEGSADFTVLSLPAGWNVLIDRPSIAPGELATATVVVPANEPDGERTVEIISDRGDVLPLSIRVGPEPPDPAIASLSAYSGFVGDTVSIYGSGLGQLTAVTLGESLLPQLSFSADRIRVQIPPGAATGLITVTRGQASSNSQIFFVKESGFVLHGPRSALRMQAGETRVLTLAISGYARVVDLAVEAAPLVASLEKTSVTPNAVSGLEIVVPAGTANGTYTVRVLGRGSDLDRSLDVSVIVGDAFEIVTNALPRGMEDTTYRESIQTRNASGVVSFSVTAGKLPVGISVGASGVVSGRPAQIGTSKFTLEALDAEGRRATAELSLQVVANGWSQSEMDGGRSRANPMATPAGDWIGWSSAARQEARAILTGRDRVFVIGESEVAGLEKATGALVYRIAGSFVRYAVAGETLYLLDAQGALHAVEGRYGNEKWSRGGVSELTTDGSTLCLGTDEGTLLIDAATGTVSAILPASLPVGGLYAWHQGSPLRLDGNTLFTLGPEGWMAIYSDAQEEMIEVACDTSGVVLLSAGGRLVALDGSFRQVASRDLGFAGTILALTEGWVVVTSAGQSAVLDRDSLRSVSESAWGGTVLAAGKEKYFVGDDYGLKAINGYSGETIWSRSGSAADLAIAGEKLFALDSMGRVTCFAAPNNLWPPTTSLSAEPGQPNGENGYYTVRPLFTLTARDPESFVRETRYRLGQEEATLYQEPVPLPEGTSQVVYWSEDSTGWRENDRLACFQVDLAPPSAERAVSGTVGPVGVYVSTVGVELSATDPVSGVDWIEYQLNDGGWTRYLSPLRLATEESFSLCYRAKDLAGNLSEAKSLELTIDLSIPQVSIHGAGEPGLWLAYLEATDSGTGIERIEFRIDGGEVATYTQPIVLTSPGMHLVSYRAEDKAGQWSPWQEKPVVVASYAPGRLVDELEFHGWQPGREVVLKVQVGERLYAPGEGRDEDNRIKALPEYLKGANFIRLNKQDRRFDGSDFVRFRCREDAAVYILKHDKSAAILGGWTLVSRDFSVEPSRYFRGGADIYRKSCKAGELVTIPGTGGGPDCWPNLIFVQRSVEQEVRITSPEPGKSLVPLTSVALAGTNLAQTVGATKRWEARLADGPWQAIAGDTMTLPYTQTEMNLELKLTMTDATGTYGGQIAERYAIVNRSDLTMHNPGPGWDLVGSSDAVLDFRATDVGGRELAREKVDWQQSRDRQSWSPAALEAGALLRVPEQTGLFYLKASWLEAAGHPREKEFGFRVIPAPVPVRIEMGAALGAECSLGEVFSAHGSGRIYGFSQDHADRVATFRVLELPEEKRHIAPRFQTETCIALDRGEAFRVSVGTGRVKTTLHVGPLENRSPDAVLLNGRSIRIPTPRIPSSHRERVMEVVAETAAQSGVLEIEGELPLMDVTIELLPADVPHVADAVREEALIVLGHRHAPALEWE